MLPVYLPHPDRRLPTQVEVLEVERKLVSRAVQVIAEIAAQFENNLKNYRSNPALLARGLYYTNNYYYALSEVDQELCDSYCTRGVLYNRHCPDEYFYTKTNARSPTGTKVNCFYLKPGVKPSVALSALREGLTLTGCGEACQIAYLEAIQYALGREKFDALFDARSPTPLKISFIEWRSPFLLNEGILEDHSWRVGAIYYFNNICLYQAKHPNGEHPGENVICIGFREGKPIFTGLGLKPEGMTAEEIAASLLDEFNRPPLSLARVSALAAERIDSQDRATASGRKMLEITQQLEDQQISALEFQFFEGGSMSPSFTTLDARKITILANSSIEEAKTIYAGWVPHSGHISKRIQACAYVALAVISTAVLLSIAAGTTLRNREL